MIMHKKIDCKSSKNEWDSLFTTKSCHLIVYWCRFLDNGWRRTVLHDRRHWRILTIYRTSGLSWVHFATRWKIIWTERLDSTEHQNWTRIGSYNLVAFKVNMEWKSEFESGNEDTSHSCVRISHGLNKLVTDLSNNKENDNNEQETSEMQFEDFALKTNVLAFASRSKAEAKPQRRTAASSSAETVPIGERKKMDWYWARR